MPSNWYKIWHQKWREFINLHQKICKSLQETTTFSLQLLIKRLTLPEKQK